MSSAALRARIACALRNERSVKILVPVRNCKLVRATVGLATKTLLTISVEMEDVVSNYTWIYLE